MCVQRQFKVTTNCSKIFHTANFKLLKLKQNIYGHYTNY